MTSFSPRNNCAIFLQHGFLVDLIHCFSAINFSLMKMVASFATSSNGTINRNQLEHSIRRNFGGFDTDSFNPMDVFRRHCRAMDMLSHQEDGRPPIDSIGLIRSSLSGQDTAVPG